MAPQRRNTGKAAVAADTVEECRSQANGPAVNPAPATSAARQPGTSTIAAGRPHSPAARMRAEAIPEVVADPPITLRDIQQLIHNELRQMYQEAARNHPPANLRTAARSLARSPIRSPLGPRRAPEIGREAHLDSPNRSRTSALERLESRGARLAREGQGQRGRDLPERQERRRELPEESTGGSGRRAEATSARRNLEELNLGQQPRREEETAKAGIMEPTPKSSRTFGRDPNSPFQQVILDAPLPPNYKAPKISRYNGTTAPRAHVSCFMTAMRFTGYDEAAYCQAFPMTLEGPAQTWFTGLRPGSVRSWEELVEAFQTRFFANSEFHKDAESLLNVVQREGESLKAYFRRFCEEQQSMQDVDPKFALTALKRGIRHPQLFYDFHTNPPDREQSVRQGAASDRSRGESSRAKQGGEA
jgi:hypothetical protein